MAQKLISPLRDRITGLERLKANVLQDHAGNWRIHPQFQVDVLSAALREVGIVDALLVYNSARQGGLTIVDGHLRKELDPAQEWPCLLTDLDDAEADYILATFDPLTALAESNKDALAALLHNVQSGESAVQQMLSQLAQAQGIVPPDTSTGSRAPDPEPQMDRAEALRQQWGTEVGQLWHCGRHRVLCADAMTITPPAGYPALLFDPPWDKMPASLQGFADTLAFCDGKTLGDVVERYGAPTWLFVWDCVTSWYTPNRPLKRGKYCCWYGDVTQYNPDGYHYGEPLKAHEVTNTRGTYSFQPDPRGKHLSDVFSLPITQAHADHEHVHSKPLDWVTLLLGNCTQGNVYDPYLGSGTSLLACERLGWVCFGVEIDPGYVAVCLERWKEATGDEPQRLSED